ncbi:hypothetical protein [Subtercola sp. YIM 133946]|uniref:hypothetical protein n=1 Tax=Subtercola sp. YIM 133946 TaxID=3118909 RepID=UPI002F91DEF8
MIRHDAACHGHFHSRSSESTRLAAAALTNERPGTLRMPGLHDLREMERSREADVRIA